MLKKLLNKEIVFDGFKYSYYTTIGELLIALGVYTLVCCLIANYILISNF